MERVPFVTYFNMLTNLSLVKISFLFGWSRRWTVCYCLWLVLIDGFKPLTCFTLQNVSPSFGVLLFLKSEGGFSCPCVLTAREIDANDVVSLLAVRRSHLSRWLRLLMLPPAVTVFHLHNLLWTCLSLSFCPLSFLTFTFHFLEAVCLIFSTCFIERAAPLAAMNMFKHIIFIAN